MYYYLKINIIGKYKELYFSVNFNQVLIKNNNYSIIKLQNFI